MPPRSEVICKDHVEVTGDQPNLADAIVEPYPSFVKKQVAMVARTLVKASESVPVRLFNPSDDIKKINKSIVVGNMCLVEHLKQTVSEGDTIELPPTVRQ